MVTPKGEAAWWGTCVLCGDAVPPDATQCPTCGQPTPGTGGTPVTIDRRVRNRLKVVQTLRILVVVAVAVGLAYVLIAAVWTGPPAISDPLTTKGTYYLGAGNFTYLAGSIAASDYILGNYSVLPANPAVGPPRNVTFEVFNQSEFGHFARHEPAKAQLSFANQSSGRILFPAPFTGTYFFVWVNPYPVASGEGLQVYVVTNYQANVVLG